MVQSRYLRGIVKDMSLRNRKFNKTAAVSIYIPNLQIVCLPLICCKMLVKKSRHLSHYKKIQLQPEPIKK